MEDIVQRMRDDIPVQLEGQDSFRVSYVSRDAQTAQKVAARLASLYIEENLRDRENLAEETNLFLESQLDEAKDRLIEYEKKLEVYRRQHAGELPSQLESNLQAIRNAQLQLQSVSESINRARERRLLIERQIADAEAFPDADARRGCGPDSGRTGHHPAPARGRAGATRSAATALHGRSPRPSAPWSARSAI